MTKPATRIRQWLKEDPSTAVVRAIQELDRPPGTALCCNPGCTKGPKRRPKECQYTGKEPGRPPRFCSADCRNAFNKARARLLEELEAYEALRRDGSTTWEQGNEIQRRISQLRMQLDRYPSRD